MDMKALLTLLITTYVLAASPATISQFSNSLEKSHGLKLGRLDDVAQKVRIRKPNFFEKWMMNKSGAEATYNDKTNTIVLREKNWRGNRIVGLSDFPMGQKYQFTILASTVFHEMMHADFDVLIKNSNSRSAIALKNVENWFRKNIRGVNAHVAAHEFFGYTASDIITGLNMDIQDILMNHGINYQQKRCFGKKGLKRIKDRLFPSGDIRFVDTKNVSQYSLKLTPRSVFIKGKGIDLKGTSFPDSYRAGIYEHFIVEYGAPKSSKDLLDFLEREYGDLLRRCYQDV